MFILFRSAQEPVVSGIDSNYIKISTLLLRIAPRAVRIKFDELFSPEVLKEVLKSNLIKISNLKTCRSINQEQWNSMFPKTGMMSRFFFIYDHFSIRSLYTIYIFYVHGEQHI